MYRPAYIKLLEALNHVIGAGLREQEAKAQILRAIADGAVGLYTSPPYIEFAGERYDVVSLIRKNVAIDNGVAVAQAIDWENSRSKDLRLEVIELKAADIERLWAKVLAFQPWSDADLAEYLQASRLPMASVAEATYVPPFMRLMFEAIDHFGLDGQKVVKAEELADWFKGKRVNGSPPISQRQAEVMATLIREPSLMTGGNRKIGKRD